MSVLQLPPPARLRAALHRHLLLEPLQFLLQLLLLLLEVAVPQVVKSRLLRHELTLLQLQRGRQLGVSLRQPLVAAQHLGQGVLQAGDGRACRGRQGLWTTATAADVAAAGRATVAVAGDAVAAAGRAAAVAVAAAGRAAVAVATAGRAAVAVAVAVAAAGLAAVAVAAAGLAATAVAAAGRAATAVAGRATALIARTGLCTGSPALAANESSRVV